MAKQAKKEAPAVEFKLPTKKVIVRPLKKPTGFIPDTNHVASFLAPGAKRRYVVPMRRDGKLQNILTDAEKKYFEDPSASGLDFKEGDLSVYKAGGFWSTFEVMLGKDDLTLDLSNPFDYFKWKVLQANKTQVASSMATSRQRVTYKYVLIDEEVQHVFEAKEADAEERAWERFGEIKNSSSSMVDVLSVYGRKVSAESTIEFLKAEVKRIIKSNDGVRKFLDIVEDPHFATKLLINKAIKTGALRKEKTSYFLDTGDRIGLTLGEAVEYLEDPMNTEVYTRLEASVN
jgi:hypothetical protein